MTGLPDLTTELAALHRHFFGANGKAARTPSALGRHEQLTKRAVTLCRDSLQPETVRAELHRMNASFDAPKPDDELERIVQWAATTVQPRSPDLKRNQAEQLVDIVQSLRPTYIADSENCAYIALPGEVPKLYPVMSQPFRSWLTAEFFANVGKTPGASALHDAVNTLEAVALHDPESTHGSVALRVGGDASEIAIDLGDNQWRCVVVTAEGWRIEPHGEHRFRRSKAAEALPEPASGGDFRLLRKYVRVDDIGWTLLASWMLAALCPLGPYPILPFFAEQGCGKTFATRLIRNLIDPSAAAVRSEPKDVRDLSIAADNSWLLALDNVSRISSEISDVLCRISTGGSFAARKLYSDREEAVFTFMRPTILTAIQDVVARPDLLDRAVTVRLQPIPEDERRTETALLAEFEADRPAIFGAMLDALSLGLRELPRIKAQKPKLPRMADFALWALATEPAYTVGEPFLEVYGGSRIDAHALALDGNVIVGAVKKLVGTVAPDETGRRSWSGSATELLTRINELSDEDTRRQRDWPRSARGLSNALRSIAPSLRSSAGFEVNTDERTGHDRKRVISLSLRPPVAAPAGQLAHQAVEI